MEELGTSKFKALEQLKLSVSAKLLSRLKADYASRKETSKGMTPSTKRTFSAVAPKLYSRILDLVPAKPADTLRYTLLYFLDEAEAKTCLSPRCGSMFVGATAYCCRKCSATGAQSTEAKRSRRKTVLKKYGSTAVVNSKAVRDKLREQAIEKHGSVAAYKAFRAEEFKQRIFRKYGVLNQSQSGKLQESIRQRRIREYGSLEGFWSSRNSKVASACQKRYGVDNFAKHKDFQPMRVDTLMRRHGSWEAAVKHQQARYVATSLKKYGTEYPMQNPEVFFSGKPRTRAKTENFRLSSGEEISLQGKLEQRVVKELDSRGYLVGAIKTSLRYPFKGKSHVYFPDFYVVNPVDGSIEVVEIKSHFTLNLHWDRNCAKFKAANLWCSEHGMKFVLCVSKLDGSLSKISWPSRDKIATLKGLP